MPQRRQRSGLYCGRALDVLVEGAERALLGAALALGAALQEEVGYRDVAGPRVHGLAARPPPMHCTAFIAAPRPSSAAWAASIGARTAPAA